MGSRAGMRSNGRLGRVKRKIGLVGNTSCAYDSVLRPPLPSVVFFLWKLKRDWAEWTEQSHDVLDKSDEADV